MKKRAYARSRVEASPPPRAPSKKQLKTVKFCFVLNDEEKRMLQAIADDDSRSMGEMLRAIINREYKVKVR